jgi:hypothetical protein
LGRQFEGTRAIRRDKHIILGFFQYLAPGFSG